MAKIALIATFLSISCVLINTHPTPIGNVDLFEGDIIGISPFLLQTKAGLIDPRYRWPNATIPYKFSLQYPEDLKEIFEVATQHISSRTCIEFVAHTNETDFIHIIQGQGCYSYVGRLGTGPQNISLPTYCNHLGIFIHELIHASGFFHEQSRSDRDDYVEILWENIKPGHKHNFQKYDASTVTSFGVEYDFNSLMHYPSDAFSANGQNTIITKPTGIPIGQLDGMSEKDVLKVNRMYNCSME